ncbi:50S ribosomal protein L23 [Henriciella sp.]|uniref:50S ribosomal protein L23 n=1 Tax=Henriciella sp. TaxID=1968823 RepID=UPI00262394C1|nr:50S ribosomal protein L23 [Henriciella sp.]
MADVKPHHYDSLLAPIITEKSTLLAEENKIVFEVPLTANKSDIRDAVQTLFKVDVTKVNTIRIKGKTKRFRGKTGFRSDFKKAIVTLKDGQSVDITTGL